VIDLSRSEAVMKMTKTILLNNSTRKLSSLRLTESNLKNKGKRTSLFVITKSRKELCKRSKTSGHTWLYFKIKFLGSKMKTCCMRSIIVMKIISIKICTPKCKWKLRTLHPNNPMAIFMTCSHPGLSPMLLRRKGFFYQIPQICLTHHLSILNSRCLNLIPRVSTLHRQTPNLLQNPKRASNLSMTKWNLNDC